VEYALWEFHHGDSPEKGELMGIKLWQLGSPGTLIYAFFDGLRKGLNAKLVNYLLTSAVPGNANLVLEAGSGPAFASSLLSRDSRVDLSVAVDLDLEALQEAKRRDDSLAAVCADLHCLPFREESVDLTWNSSTLEHLGHPDAALGEMRRVTRRGGSVFVGVPNLYGPLGFQRLIPETSVGVWIGTTFNRNELSNLMTRVGLNPLDCIFYFFRFFVGILAKKPT
jgi:SAM-dependent methyltransferase